MTQELSSQERRDSEGHFSRRGRAKEAICLGNIGLKGPILKERRDSRGRFSKRGWAQEATSPREAALKRPLF